LVSVLGCAWIALLVARLVRANFVL
jgi:hypothetical protein